MTSGAKAVAPIPTSVADWNRGVTHADRPLEKGLFAKFPARTDLYPCLGDGRSAEILPTSIANGRERVPHSQRRLIALALATSLAAVGYLFLRFSQSKTDPSSPIDTADIDPDPSMEAAARVIQQNIGKALASGASSWMPTISYARDAFIATTAAAINRALFSESSFMLSNSSICSVTATEGFSLLELFKTWKVFGRADLGRLIVSTNFPLPPGVTLRQSQVKLETTLEITNTRAIAYKGTNDKALYVATAPSPTVSIPPVQIVNANKTSDLYPSNNFNVGTEVSDMLIVNNFLGLTGEGTLLQLYDVTQSFNPTLYGRASNGTVNGVAIASSGVGLQFGCVASDGFYLIDGADLESPPGYIPGLQGTVITGFPGYFLVGDSAGFHVIDITTPTKKLKLEICKFLPIPLIQSIEYWKGYAYVGTLNKLIVINLSNPCDAKVVNEIDVAAGFLTNLFPHDNLIHFTATGQPGFGVFDNTNRSNPVIAASGLLPGSGFLNTGVFVDDKFVMANNQNVFVATSEDSFSFSGAPVPGSKDTYIFPVRATTFDGTVLTDEKTCEITVLPAIKPKGTVPDVIAVANQVSTVVLPTLYDHEKGLPIDYRLTCPAGDPITAEATLNSASRELTVHPTAVGSRTCTIEGADSLGSVGEPRPIRITSYYGPTLEYIPDQVVIIGQMYSLPLVVSSQDPLSKFTFTAVGLPAGFELKNGIISGNSLFSGTYPVTVTVTDQNNNKKIQSYIMNIIAPTAPVFRKAPGSRNIAVGNSFNIDIPYGTAVNPNNPNATIIYTAKLANTDNNSTGELPSWMSMVPKSKDIRDGYKIFSDYIPRSAIEYDDQVLSIVLTATELLAGGLRTSSFVIFDLTVGGTSYSKIAAGSVGGMITVGGLAYRARQMIYNKLARTACFIPCLNKIKINSCTLAIGRVFSCCLSKPSKLVRIKKTFEIGKRLEYVFSTDSDEINGFKTLYGKIEWKVGSSLPQWLNWLTLSFDERGKKKLSAEIVQYKDIGDARSFTIIACNDEYDKEEVTFTRKEEEMIDSKDSGGSGSPASPAGAPLGVTIEMTPTSSEGTIGARLI